MNNDVQYLFYKKVIPKTLIYINSKYLLILFFIYLFPISKEQTRINLVIKGDNNNWLNFINEDFNSEPSEILVNGEIKYDCKKSCKFHSELNNVRIDFGKPLESLEIMFSGITNIIEIDLSHFDASLVINMALMFNNCENLENIIFGNINTSLVKNMDCLFHGCKKLSSIDLTNFNTWKVTNMGSMFKFCESLISIDVSNFNTSNVETMYDIFARCKKLSSIDVSNFDTSNVKIMQGMFFVCEKLEYLDLSNFNTSSVKTMYSMFAYSESLVNINLFSFKIRKDVNISTIFDFNSDITLFLCVKDEETFNLLKTQKKNLINDCSYFCFKKNLKYNIRDNACVENCYDSESKYEYNNSCYEICPNTTFVSSNNEFKCLNKTSEGVYYCDKKKSVFKECYKTCKKCEEEGNQINNNCIECFDEFIFINDSIFKSNCYKQCTYYYYFDENDNYTCTESQQCPEKFSKLIPEKNECVDRYDEPYTYDYNSVSVSKSSNDTKENNSDSELIDEDIFLHNFRDYIHNTDITKNVIENKKDFIMKKNNVTYQITTTENQNNNKDNNISTIDLKGCEKILREKNDINESLPLIILKIDYKTDDLLIPIIGYEIYHPISKIQLDLTDCKDIKFDIPVSIEEDKLFKHNPKSEFYNDDCSSYTTENGTDIILTDRKQEFKDKNLSLCQNNCEYIGYNTSNKQSSCECIIQNKIDSISEIIKNPNLLANDFPSDKSDSKFLSSNVETMKCTKSLFSKSGILTNISSYIIIVFFLHFLLSIILFMKCGYHLLENNIKEIVNSKKEEKITKPIKFIQKKKQFHKKRTKNFPPKKFNSNNSNLNTVKSSRINLKNHKKNLGLNNNILKANTNKNIKGKNVIFKPKINPPKKSFKDIELNSFIYEKALLFDKRTFSEYYISLLKAKHPLIFSFCPMNDYNTLVIKMCIFSLSFSIYYTINFAFFDDKIIHKLYEEGGRYDILFFLPKIAIAFCISHFISVIIKLIFLSHRNILQVKEQPTYSKADEMASIMKRRIIIKYVIFFILGIVFLLFFWMLLSSFGAVYQNTQIIVFENTLISFGISFIYPFFINIIPVIFRISSISSKSKGLYNFSKFLQIL